jgi:hypothetical protein
LWVMVEDGFLWLTSSLVIGDDSFIWPCEKFEISFRTSTNQRVPMSFLFHIVNEQEYLLCISCFFDCL